MEYAFHILVLVGIFGLLSVSLNLIAGYAGLLSLAHAAFFGIGAYTTAILSTRAGAPIWLTIPASFGICAMFGALLGGPAFRTRDDTFAILTFAVQIVFYGLFNNLNGITGGPSGIPGIPAARLFGLSLQSNGSFLLLTLALLALAIWSSARIARSGYGRVLFALREDEVFAAAAGKNVFTAKIVAFTIASAIAGVAGALYAVYLTFIDPTSFAIMESIFVIAAVIIGGAGSVWGPLLGVGVLIILPEALRFLGLPSSIAPNIRQILYGLALIGCMLWRPQGLIGRYAFGRDTKSK